MIARAAETVVRQLAPAGISPALVTAFAAQVVAILIVAINPRRPANRFWALALTFQALWQGSIGLAEAYSAHGVARIGFVRLGAGAAFGMWWTAAPLYESIVAPWASVGTTLARAKGYALLLALAFLALTPWFIPAGRGLLRPIGPVYLPLTLIGIGVGCWYLLRGLAAARRRAGGGAMQAELLAYAIFAAGAVAVAVLDQSAWRLGPRESGGLAPLCLWAAYGGAGVMLFASNGLALRDLERIASRTAARAALYGAAASLIVATLAFLARRDMVIGEALVWLLIAFGVALLPSVDAALESLLDRHFTSPSFIRAQAAVDAVIRSSTDSGTVHRECRHILREWSGGSDEVFLSDGAFASEWPGEQLPLGLLRVVAERGGVTPETLVADGEDAREFFEYLTRNHIGAVACATGGAGERLVAAFEVRTARGPFLPWELKEARALLATTQMGIMLARMRQRLRGHERLNFYAQYAPQFAHELRNGLYLQTQLLSAIAEGRGGEVRPEDARCSLEHTEQIDRICEHFFNVGSLFKRPIEPISLRELLEPSLEQAGPAPGAVRLAFEAPGETEVLANPDLLRMAVRNLVKNGLEAAAGERHGPAVEVVVARELDKVHLLVRDRGGGLPEDRRIDPFSPGRSQKRDGMGLGLSIVRDCVEAMGGTVGVRYTGPEGTCFEVTLVCAQRFDGAAVPCSFITDSA